MLDRLYIDRAFRFHLAYVNRDSDSAIILIPNDQLHDDKNLVSLVPQFWKSSLEPWGIVATHQSPNNSEVLIIMVGNPTILGYRQFDRSTVGTYSDLVDKMKWQANEIVHMHLKVSGGNTTTYNWDFESNLIGIDFPGTSNDDSHEYDRAGRRIRSKLNGASDAALPLM